MPIFQESELGVFISEPTNPSNSNHRTTADERSSQRLLKQRGRQVAQLQSRVSELQQMLAESDARFTSLQQDASESRTRSDTIILQLTRQLERSQLQLEDNRRHRTLWERLRHLFVPDPV